jgi:hypothetical protein
VLIRQLLFNLNCYEFGFILLIFHSMFRMEDLGVISDDDLYLRIKYDGKVEWEPPRLFITHCQVCKYIVKLLLIIVHNINRLNLK